MVLQKKRKLKSFTHIQFYSIQIFDLSLKNSHWKKNSNLYTCGDGKLKYPKRIMFFFIVCLHYYYQKLSIYLHTKKRWNIVLIVCLIHLFIRKATLLSLETYINAHNWTFTIWGRSKRWLYYECICSSCLRCG